MIGGLQRGIRHGIGLNRPEVFLWHQSPKDQTRFLGDLCLRNLRASRIVCLTSADFKHQAARFLRWRAKNRAKRKWARRPKGARIARRWTDT